MAFKQIVKKLGCIQTENSRNLVFLNKTFSTFSYQNGPNKTVKKGIRKPERLFKEELGEMIPEGVSSEFFNFYRSTYNKTLPQVPKHGLPQLIHLNQLLSMVAKPEEVELIPGLMETWRRKQLVKNSEVTDLVFQHSINFGKSFIAYDMLADIHRYNLEPTVKHFNSLLQSFVYEYNNLGEEASAETKDKKLEEIVILYGLLDCYGLKVDEQFGNLLISTILSSHKVDDWKLFLGKLTNELKIDGISIDNATLETVKKLKLEYGRELNAKNEKEAKQE